MFGTTLRVHRLRLGREAMLRGVLTLFAYLLSSLLHAGGDIVLSGTFISTVS